MGGRGRRIVAGGQGLIFLMLGTVTDGDEKGAGEGTGKYVFCHNDLGKHNVIVNPDTLKIKAIID